MSEETKKFECSYCGKSYASPTERARCEIKCDKEFRLAELRKAKQEKEKHEAELLNEINNVISNVLNPLLVEFTKNSDKSLKIAGVNNGEGLKLSASTFNW